MLNSFAFGKRDWMKSSSVYWKPTDESVTGSKTNALASILPPPVKQPGMPEPASGFYSSSCIFFISSLVRSFSPCPPIENAQIR
jgi:hypothetical protein